MTEILADSGGSSLMISAASATGSGYSISGLALSLTLTAGQSTTFSVQFAPPAAGAASGNVAITSNGANPNLNIALSGTGGAPETLSGEFSVDSKTWTSWFEANFTKSKPIPKK